MFVAIAHPCEQGDIRNVGPIRQVSVHDLSRKEYPALPAASGYLTGPQAMETHATA
jgi:hypothetical protein